MYHIAARAPEGERLFLDDHDFSRFESELERVLSPDCTCVAGCALNTHYHLLLQVENDVLSKAVHLLNSRYAAAYKLRYGIRGHIFSERYMSVLILSEEHLLTAYRYIARNPVEAGLCDDPADWKWSSYPAAIGLGGRFSFADPSLVLAACDDSVDQLRRFVEAAQEPGPGPERGLAPVLTSGARPPAAPRASRRA